LQKIEVKVEREESVEVEMASKGVAGNQPAIVKKPRENQINKNKNKQTKK
jgi:hypothetical protein